MSKVHTWTTRATLKEPPRFCQVMRYEDAEEPGESGVVVSFKIIHEPTVRVRLSMEAAACLASQLAHHLRVEDLDKADRLTVRRGKGPPRKHQGVAKRAEGGSDD